MDDQKDDLVTLKKIWLWIPGVLSVLGLSSIVSGVVIWYSFMRDAVVIYSFVRNQIFDWVFGWWLWFPVPDILVDSVVVCGCFLFAGKLLFGDDTLGTNFVTILNKNSYRRKQLNKGILILDTEFSRGIIKIVFYRYITYLSYIFGSFIFLLFINWQILDRLG